MPTVQGHHIDDNQPKNYINWIHQSLNGLKSIPNKLYQPMLLPKGNAKVSMEHETGSFPQYT